MQKKDVRNSLQSCSQQVLLIMERERSSIVIGAPHHAPAGSPNLPCLSHPVSDENVGYLADYLGERLGCCSIIACNYRVDANKSLDTDYAIQIANWTPKILVEIHGHGGKKVGSNVVEISSGSEARNDFSIRLAKRLSVACSRIRGLENISVVGDFRHLYFKAAKSVTISDDRWISYHLELPPLLRKENNRKTQQPPQVAYSFCDALIANLTKLHETELG